MRRRRPHPSSGWIICDCTIATDNKVAVQVLHIVRSTVSFNISLAGIYSPGRVSDLPPNEGLIPRFPKSERDVGLPFRQVDISLADNQLHPQSRITRMKCVDEWRLPQARCKARSAGHPNSAGEPLVAGREVTLEGGHRCLHTLGIGQQFLSKFG